MPVGSIVTITVDYPDGLDGVNDYVKGLVGVVTEFFEGRDIDGPSWKINTSSIDEGYYYSRDQFRQATENEMADALRSLLM